jgi:hypothetical protein
VLEDSTCFHPIRSRLASSAQQCTSTGHCVSTPAKLSAPAAPIRSFLRLTALCTVPELKDSLPQLLQSHYNVEADKPALCTSQHYCKILCPGCITAKIEASQPRALPQHSCKTLCPAEIDVSQGCVLRHLSAPRAVSSRTLACQSLSHSECRLRSSCSNGQRQAREDVPCQLRLWLSSRSST